MTARQRGPPPSSSRSTHPSYGYSWQAPADDREALNNDPYIGDRYPNARGGGQRDFYPTTSDTSLPSPYPPTRNRTDSNVSLPLENQRIPRSQGPSSGDESRARGDSMSSSPNRTYRDDTHPRSGHSNNNPATSATREKIYFSASDFQPPLFPQHPYGATRHSIAIESQEAAKPSRPNSRTQSPIPPYPATPPPSRSSPEHARGRGNSNRQIQVNRTRNLPIILFNLRR